MLKYEVVLEARDGRRRAVFHDVPLLEVQRGGPDADTRIAGLLPADVQTASVGDRLVVRIGGTVVADAEVSRVAPAWGDARKLILGRYVSVHSVIEVEAVAPWTRWNTWSADSHAQRSITNIVREAINAAPGAVHYTVAHGAYPEGAQREYAKFAARMESAAALPVGGIDSGQWVGPERIDASGAYALDGDTIRGLVVDGVAWPDLRLMMVDTEELSLNSHTYSRHPETADWTATDYANSGYYLKAVAARDFLQGLIDAHGITHLELNPHRDALGAFDDRVDVYGRYLGFVYGGGLCFNAALVEQGHSAPYLYADGRYLPRDFALKDYFSYTGISSDSVAEGLPVLRHYEFAAGVLETLTALAACAGCTFSVDPAGAVRFAPAGVVERAIYYDPRRHSMAWGLDRGGVVNRLALAGNPVSSGAHISASRTDSIAAYGESERSVDYFALRDAEDLRFLAEGLLADLAYPAVVGEAVWHEGDAEIAPGQLLELRGAPLGRLEAALPEQWDGQFGEQLVGRVREVRHRLQGKRVETRALLASPLRSVANPLHFITRSQPPAELLFSFAVDVETAGLDVGVHLD